MLASEHQEQVTFAKYMHLAHPTIPWFAIPNGGHRHPIVAAKLKAEGVKAGVPDICIAVPRLPFHGLFIELKRKKNGAVSPAQKEMLGTLEKHGYKCVVAKGADQAIDAVKSYLNIAN